MSHVYAARDTLIGRTVAVKILTDAGALDDSTRARFVREAQLAGNIIHDNIIRVYDFGDEAGRLFMVMEYLEGEDMNDAIQNGRSGSLGDQISVALQITRAMEHIHSLEIVHRDLKPHNVFITRNGVAKLMDFGIAKTVDTSLTKTGFALGTPSYMAPEQVLGKALNHLSDVYSFGIMLYELITGAKPLQGDSLERVFWLVLNEPVDLSKMQAVGAPPALLDLVRRCTEKDPALRPQTFTEIRQTLETLAGRGAAQAMPTAHTAAAAATVPIAQPGVNAKGRKWLIPAVVGAVGLIALAAVLLVVMRNSGTEPKTSTASKAAEHVPVATVPPLAVSGEMVLVEAGPFLSGKNNERLETAAYYIDKTEVTNAAYSEFLKATNYPAPPEFGSEPPGFPVVNVTMRDARQFASWAGKRLPTDVEWEKAARGNDGRRFSWGNQVRKDVAVRGGLPLRDAASANAASPYGALEMTGNVLELVEGQVTPSAAAVADFARRLSPPPTATEPWRHARGGSFLIPLKDIPLWEFLTVPERFRARDFGFRCARDVR